MTKKKYSEILKKYKYHITWIVIFVTYFVWGLFEYQSRANFCGGVYCKELTSFLNIHHLLCLLSVIPWFIFFATLATKINQD
jgi:hypothetical protein